MSAEQIEPTWWRRLAHTPMRDVIRGRMSGRLDIRAIVAASGLPPECRGVIERVVRRTRLWPLEKADVCRELIAHFADGLAAGADEASLRRAFGDERSAARLIRRAKRRQRPVISRVVGRAAQAGQALLAVGGMAYGVMALRYYDAEPVVKRDYVAELNAAAMRVPEEERAWPIYREALLPMRPLFPRTVRYATLSAAEPHWSVWPESVRRIEECRSSIEALRRAAAMPGLGYVANGRVAPEDAALLGAASRDKAPLPPGAIPMVGTIMTLYLSELQIAAIALRLDALAAATEGDGERVAADVAAIVGVAFHAREIPLYINQLVAASMVRRASRVAAVSVWSYPESLSDDNLRSMAAALSRASLSLDVRAEKAPLDDFIQRVYSDDGAGRGVVTAAGMRLLDTLEDSTLTSTPEQRVLASVADRVFGPLQVVGMAERSSLQAVADKLFDAAQADADEPLIGNGGGRMERLKASIEASPLGKTRYALLLLLMPTLKNVALSAGEDAMWRDAALLAIALERYRRRDGHWPATLADLTPDLIPTVPIDRYDGGQIRYMLRDGAPILYSVGPDRTDNGGVMKSVGLPNFTARGLNAGEDWVLHPPPRTVEPRRPEDDTACSPDG